MRPDTVAIGRLGEAIAAHFLELQGYRVLERNYRFGHLEIDLIVRRGQLLAVVEVKYRFESRRGGAVSAVPHSKQRDLETAAVGYVKHRNLRGVALRFDVVALDGEAGELRVRHLPDAFRATGRYRL